MVLPSKLGHTSKQDFRGRAGISGWFWSGKAGGKVHHVCLNINGLVEGKIYRKPLNLIIKNMVFCRFPLNQSIDTVEIAIAILILHQPENNC